MLKQWILLLSVFGFAAAAQTPSQSQPSSPGPSHIEEATPGREPAKKHSKKKSKKKKKSAKNANG